MPGKVILAVVDGPLAGKSFEFSEHDTFIFGRDADCHAKLADTDTTASRHHFILEANPPDARVRDLGSLNGTYVNDTKYGGRSAGETPQQAAKRQYPAVDLKHGDRISVGGTSFTVAVDLPAACHACGLAIPDAFKSLCKSGDGRWVCPECREKLSRGIDARSLAPARPTCSQCGADVASEIGNARRGDYVCAACRSRVAADPMQAVLDMLLKSARARGEAPLAEIPGYEVGGILGKGGMGAVYRATRKRDGKQAAIKVMLSQVAVDEASRDGFLREIEVTKALRHPNIVELYDHGSAGSGFFFAMELCPGGSIDGLMMRRGGRLSVPEAGRIALQALDGLSFLHEQGFVHRDLKPQNILLTDPEGRAAVKVSDLGLAKSFEKAGFSGMTATGTAAGTPFFMPREQVTNFKFVKPVTDVWSMAATIYCMITGRGPREFPADKDPMEVVLRGAIVPIRQRDPAVPEKVAEAIDAALVDKAKDRIQTAAELRRLLAAAL